MDLDCRFVLVGRGAVAAFLASGDEAAYERLRRRQTAGDPAGGHLAYALLDLVAGRIPKGPPPDDDQTAFRDACLFYQGLAAVVEREGKAYPFAVSLGELLKLERLCEALGPEAAARVARLRTGRWWVGGEPGVLDVLGPFGTAVGWLTRDECAALDEALKAAPSLADDRAVVRRMGGDPRSVISIAVGAREILHAPLETGTDLFSIIG